MIEKGVTDFDWNLAFEMACKSGHLEIAKLMIKHGANALNRGLLVACKGGHMDVIDLLMKRKDRNCRDRFYEQFNGDMDHLMEEIQATKYDWGLSGACEGGHMDIVNLMIQKGAVNWNMGLIGACAGGFGAIADLMIKKGADDFSLRLYGVCLSGHFDIVKLIITNRCYDSNPYLDDDDYDPYLDDDDGFYSGFEGACEGGHVDIIDLLIENGVDNWNIGLKGACRGGHVDIIRMLIEKGADYWHPLASVNDLSLYKLYLKKIGKFNQMHYRCLISYQDPLYCVVINHYQEENRLIRMLPVDIWKLMMPFFL